MILDVQIFSDRTREGVATFLPAGGKAPATFRCLAKSDNQAALEHFNPTRNQLLPFGDLPEGEYNGVRTAVASLRDVDSYGAGPRWVLNPIAGPALVAMRNGRFGLLIHGGILDAGGHLRATHGCLRIDNQSTALLGAMSGNQPIQVTVRTVDTIERLEGVAFRYGPFYARAKTTS